VGIFTVLRGQSFAGHALTDVATAGGAGASLAAVSPLLGFIGGAVIGAGAMDAIGVQRVKNRDVATGVVLGAATGLAALFLYLITLQTTTTGSTQSILFGSVFTVASSTLPDALVLGALVLVGLGMIRRPLLMSSISPELAAARGVRLRSVGIIFMVMLAVAVGLSAIVIGSILSTALLIGPPASALRVSTRLSRAIVLACAFGVGATWLGIVFAYDSYYWFGAGHGLPVSFFVVADVFIEFVLVSFVAARRQRVLTSPAPVTSRQHVEWV
jgi:zinc/manganese transport system permease protein